MDDYGETYALGEDLLVFAHSDHTLTEILDRIDGRETWSLATDRQFNQTRAALPPRRFATIYITNYSGLAEMFGWEFCHGDLATPEWVAASVGWAERGVVLDVISPVTTRVPWACHLPIQPGGREHLDLRRVMDIPNIDDLDIDRRLHDALSTGLSAVELSSTRTSDHQRVTFKLALLPRP